MQIEIPDLDIIIGLVGAFVLGLVVLTIYYKIRPYVNLTSRGQNVYQNTQLEEYEHQFIEMKIRMDALAMGGTNTDVIPTSHAATNSQITGVSVESTNQNIVPKFNKNTQATTQSPPNITHHNATQVVLHQVTDSPKTSHDIQMSLGKSREHTSRFLKKLFDEGLVNRNVNSKPYTYSITNAGRTRLHSL